MKEYSNYNLMILNFMMFKIRNRVVKFISRVSEIRN